MKPTNDDLVRLIPEAAQAANGDEQTRGVDVATQQAAMLLRMLAEQWHTGDWPILRRWALRALYLCALIAWEAGRRMAPADRCGKRHPDGSAACDLAFGHEFPGHHSATVWTTGSLPVARAWEDPPTTAETPTAKHDVEALLEEAAKHTTGAKAPWSAAGVIERLAVALRAERERAERLYKAGCQVEEQWQATTAHLRAVLDFMWPGDGGPTVVQKARAFLAGESQATRHDDAQEIKLLRKELADKGAALERMVERYEKERAHVDGLVDAVRAAKAEVRVEDEAHAHTKARLAEVERYVDENVQARQKAQYRAADLDLRLTEALKGQTRASDELAKAIAAQNRAESEAASLRIEVTDLRRKLAEGDVMVDQLVAWAKKGRA